MTKTTCTLLLLLLALITQGQTESIDVFVDCDFCNTANIKQSLPYINYPIDRRNANVYALFTRQTNGSGGRTITIQFYGQNNFEGINDSISYLVPINTPQVARNNMMVEHIERGLLGYLLKSSLSNYVSFNYRPKQAVEEQHDPWNNWVFTIGANARFRKETSFKSTTGSSSLSVRRITEDLKIRSYTSYFQRTDIYDIDGEELKSFSEEFYSSHLVVKSMSNHWSYGGEVILQSSFFENIKFQDMYWLALEYNLFPYSEANRRQFRITPEVGYDHRQYNDTTIFNQIEEGFFVLDLLLAFEMKEKWGEAGADVEAVSFLYDPEKYQLSASGFVRLRLFKGLTLDMNANVSMIRNQIALPKGDFSSEAILLQQRQLATNFRFSSRVGFSYTFGSKHNNIVNPRFGW